MSPLRQFFTKANQVQMSNPALRKVTVILTLVDRSAYTRQYLHSNIVDGLNYMIVDASVGNENFEECMNAIRGGIEYFREPVDQNLHDHLNKLIRYLSRAKTPYVLLSDNDDLILPRGIVAAAEALNSNLMAVAAGGAVLGYKGRGTPTRFASLPYMSWGAPSGMGLSAILESRNVYQSTWYSLYRRNVLLDILTEVAQWKITDPYLVEYAMCDLTFASGPFVAVNSPMYARLTNQKSRTVQSSKSFQSEGWRTRTWFAEADQFDSMLAKRLKVSKDDLTTNAKRWILLAHVPSTHENFWSQWPVYLRLLTSSFTILPFWLMRFLARRGLYV